MNLRALLLLACVLGAAAGPAGVLASPPDPSTAAEAVKDRLEKARLALAAGRLDEATRLARGAIDTPGAGKAAAPAYGALATALYQAGDRDGAVSAFKSALAIDPGYSSALVGLGAIASIAGRTTEARQYLEDAIRITPDLMLAHEWLGTVLQQLGDTAGAIHEYELGLLKTEPSYVGNKFNLAALYSSAGRATDAVRLLEPLVKPATAGKRELLILGTAYLNAGDANKALPLLSKALTLDRNDASAALELGVAQSKAGLNYAALEQLQRAAAARPQSALVQYNLGAIYVVLKEFPAAEASFVRAIELDPKSIPFRQALGETMLLEGKPAAALSVFEPVTQSDLAAPGAYDGLARAYTALRRPLEAEATYRKAIERFPQDSLAYSQLGAMLVGRGRVNDALILLRDGNAKIANDPRLLKGLAFAQSQAGDLQDAMKTARQLVGIAPKDADAEFALASLTAESGDMAQAIILYRSVIADDPNHAQALNNLAWALIESGDASSAIPFAERAKTLLPGNADVTDTLGWALLKSGQIGRALTTLTAANGLRERDPMLIYHLAVAESSAGNRQAALATVSRALRLSQTFKEAAAAQALQADLSK